MPPAVAVRGDTVTDNHKIKSWTNSALTGGTNPGPAELLIIPLSLVRCFASENCSFICTKIPLQKVF